MNNKIIDFKQSKEKILNKKYPNVSTIAPNKNNMLFLESNKALETFQKILINYENYLVDPHNNKEIKLEEVMMYYNRYFDLIYKELSRFDDSKVKEFKEALDYAMLSSGKRLRPFLMLVTYNFFEGKNLLLLTPYMVAIELIHTFSLVHDDLPCMDNDELRRGKPTVWKKYGEDIAVLVGDALLMQAFSIIIDTIFEFAYTEIGSFVISSSNILVKLAGLDGMITGQVFDVMNTGNNKLTINDIIYMYDKKTTALLSASMIIGTNLSLINSDKLNDIENLGLFLGEAYQIKDDLLEIESDVETIGKSNVSDKNNNKVTYIEKVGVNESKERLKYLEESCILTIDKMTKISNYKESCVFKELIKYMFQRVK